MIATKPYDFQLRNQLEMKSSTSSKHPHPHPILKEKTFILAFFWKKWASPSPINFPPKSLAGVPKPIFPYFSPIPPTIWGWFGPLRLGYFRPCLEVRHLFGAKGDFWLKSCFLFPWDFSHGFFLADFFFTWKKWRCFWIFVGCF